MCGAASLCVVLTTKENFWLNSVIERAGKRMESAGDNAEKGRKGKAKQDKAEQRSTNRKYETLNNAEEKHLEVVVCFIVERVPLIFSFFLIF